jgi:hypothetical protein
MATPAKKPAPGKKGAVPAAKKAAAKKPAFIPFGKGGKPAPGKKGGK